MKEWGDHNLGTRTPECAFEKHLLSTGWALERDCRCNAYEPKRRIYTKEGKRDLWFGLYNTAFFISYHGDWEVPQWPEEFELFDSGEWKRYFEPR